MLPYNAKDLAAAFRTVRNNTIQIAEEIPEDKYGFVPVEGWRTVAQLLVHMAVSDRLARMVHGGNGNKLTTLEGLNFPGFIGTVLAEERQPRSKAEILDLLRSTRDSFSAFIETLPDEFLSERVGMPAGAEPTSKTRFEMLMSVKEHEMHHRGQLMLMQRMLGITPHLTRARQERFAAARI